MVVAVRDGQLEAIQWLVAHMPRNEEIPEFCLLYEAAKNGHLEILQYFQSLGPSAVPGYGWSLAPCAIPSDEGYITFRKDRRTRLQWLLSTSPKWRSTDAMDIAAANGHLAVVKWLHFNRPEGCTIAAMNKAASHGRIDVVQWLHSNRSEGCTTKAMDKAASNNHLDVLEWLHANRSEGCTKVAIEEALGSGYLQVVCWLREHYPKLKPTTVDHPIQNPNSFETLLFLHLFYQSLITPRFLENTLEMLGYMDEHTLDTHIRRWLEAKYLD